MGDFLILHPGAQDQGRRVGDGQGALAVEGQHFRARIGHPVGGKERAALKIPTVVDIGVVKAGDVFEGIRCGRDQPEFMGQGFEFEAAPLHQAARCRAAGEQRQQVKGRAVHVPRDLIVPLVVSGHRQQFMLTDVDAQPQTGIPSIGFIGREIVAGDGGVVWRGIDSREHQSGRQKAQKGSIGRHRAHGGVAAGRFALAALAKDRCRDAVAQVEHQLATHAPRLVAVHFLTGGDVVDVPVLAILDERAQPEAGGIAQRATHGQPEIHLVVGGVSPPKAEVELFARGLGDHVDHASRSVLAEQGALGTAQHFDALDVQQVAEGLGGSDQGHVVHDDGDARFNVDAEHVGADAPQAETAVGGPVAPVDRQRR